LEERQLVVVRDGTTRIALCVDVVHDPEELSPAAVASGDELGGAGHGLLREGLLAIARGQRGVMPVLEPSSLASRSLLAELASSLRGTR
jgi:hypothetical protein